MRAALYARISRDRSGLSEGVDIQEREARTYASDVRMDVVFVARDDDISASRYSTKPRPGYLSLVDAIRRGEVEAIIVTEFSRLYRRLEELLDLIRLAETTSLRKIETTDGLGYDLSTGVGIYNAVSAVNNSVLESRKISDRVKRRKRASAQEGKNSGGSRAFGYEKDGVTIRESEAAVLRECARRVIAGDRVSVITRDLNQRGVPTVYGKQWRIENLKRLLENRRYVGMRTHNDAEYPAVWPAILTDEEHELVKLAYKQLGVRPVAPKGVRSYLLTGYLYCGVCEKPMVGNAHIRNGVSTRRYKCRKMDNHGGADGCGGVYRVAEPLELFVGQTILHRLDTVDLTRMLAEQDNAPDATVVMERFDAQRRRLDDIVDDYATGLLTKQQMARAKATAEATLERLHGEMVAMQQRRTLSVLPQAGHMRRAWESGSLDWKRQIISLLVERVLCDRGHPGGHFYEGYRFDPAKVRIEWRV